jgi:hypothetical protein
MATTYTALEKLGCQFLKLVDPNGGLIGKAGDDL